MSYRAITIMATNQSLIARIGACAAAEGQDNPMAWAQQFIYRIVAPRRDWVDAWQAAEDAKTVNVNPDTGARADVITDDMILSAVQAVRKQGPPQ